MSARQPTFEESSDLESSRKKAKAMNLVVAELASIEILVLKSEKRCAIPEASKMLGQGDHTRSIGPPLVDQSHESVLMRR